MGKITVYEVQITYTLDTDDLIKVIVKKYQTDRIRKNSISPFPEHNLLIEKYYFNSAIKVQNFLDRYYMKPWDDSLWTFYAGYLGKWSDEVKNAKEIRHRRVTKGKKSYRS